MESEENPALERMLFAAVQDPVERGRRLVSRKLIEGLQTGGRDELFSRARAYRCRIPLYRQKSDAAV
jgi:hypothetical protein